MFPATHSEMLTSFCPEGSAFADPSYCSSGTSQSALCVLHTILYVMSPAAFDARTAGILARETTGEAIQTLAVDMLPSQISKEIANSAA